MLACHTPMMETEGEEGIYASTMVSETTDQAKDQLLTFPLKASSGVFLEENSQSPASDTDDSIEDLFSPLDADWGDDEKQATVDEKPLVEDSIINGILVQSSPPLEKSKLVLKSSQIFAEDRQVSSISETKSQIQRSQRPLPEVSTDISPFLHSEKNSHFQPLLVSTLETTGHDAQTVNQHSALDQTLRPAVSVINCERDNTRRDSRSSTSAQCLDGSTEETDPTEDEDEYDLEAELERELQRQQNETNVRAEFDLNTARAPRLELGLENDRQKQDNRRKRKFIEDGSWQPNRLSFPSHPRVESSESPSQTRKRRAGSKSSGITTGSVVDSLELSNEEPPRQCKRVPDPTNPFTFNDEQRLAICLMIIAKNPKLPKAPLAQYYKVSPDKLCRTARLASPFTDIETSPFGVFPSAPAQSSNQSFQRPPDVSPTTVVQGSVNVISNVTIGFSTWEEFHIYHEKLRVKMKEELRAELEAEFRAKSMEEMNTIIKQQLRVELRNELRAELLAPITVSSGNFLVLSEQERLAKILSILHANPKAIKKELAKEYNVSYDKVLRLNRYGPAMNPQPAAFIAEATYSQGPNALSTMPSFSPMPITAMTGIATPFNEHSSGFMPGPFLSPSNQYNIPQCHRIPHDRVYDPRNPTQGVQEYPSIELNHDSTSPNSSPVQINLTGDQ